MFDPDVIRRQNRFAMAIACVLASAVMAYALYLEMWGHAFLWFVGAAYSLGQFLTCKD